MTIVILFILGMTTVAYQADKPCNAACFKAKIDHEANIKRKTKQNHNSWRHSRSPYESHLRRDR